MTTLGCDPEFVILDSNNNPVPAHSIGFSDKTAPLRIGNYGKAFRDGFNVEINVLPETCRGNLLNFVKSVMQEVVLRQLPAGYKMTTRAAYQVDLSKLEDAPEDVKYFGCDPSMDAYTGKEKRIIIDATTHPTRYAGGHMHFGGSGYFPWKGVKQLTDPDSIVWPVWLLPENHATLVKLFDKYIGLPLAVIFNSPDEFERRRYYGQAGEYRWQKYDTHSQGVEYRVPSARVFNNSAIAALFLGVGRAVCNHFGMLSAGDYLPSKRQQTAICTAINTGRGALRVLESANPSIPDYYNRDIILKLREDAGMHEFTFDKFTSDCHTSWPEWGYTKDYVKGGWMPRNGTDWPALPTTWA